MHTQLSNVVSTLNCQTTSFVVKDPKAIAFEYDLQSHSADMTQFVDLVATEAKLNRTKQKNAAKLILLNFIVSQSEAVHLTVDNNFHMDEQYSPLGVGITTLITTSDRLSAAGLIVKVTGKNLPHGNGIQTTLRPSSALCQRLSKLKVTFEYPKLVVLRRKIEKVKVPIGYLDTMRADEIQCQLQRYNSLLVKTKIELRDTSGLMALATPYVKRMFIDNGEVDSVGRPRFNAGGRLYAPWASLSPTDRLNIWIDGEPTVEEDFVASYVNVMYRAVTGNTYVGDPYILSLDGEQLPRHIVKTLASMALNNGSEGSAFKAFRKKLQKLKGSKDPTKIARYKDFQSYKLDDQLAPVLTKFLNMHRPIKHLFLKGKELGNKVQCLESDLVFSIVDELTWVDIPCLTVHDSIIVQSKHQGLVKLLMDTTTFPDKELVGWLV